MVVKLKEISNLLDHVNLRKGILSDIISEIDATIEYYDDLAKHASTPEVEDIITATIKRFSDIQASFKVKLALL